MPEYLAPGVYVEEVSFRPKTIEGVSTSTAGFVGPTRFGPVNGEPELLTSFADFERIYGGLDPLLFGAETRTNYLAFAVRNFFDEGGKRLYVARVLGTGAVAAAWQADTSPLPGVQIAARYPGRAGNGEVVLVLRLSDNIAHADDGGTVRLVGARNRDTVIAATGSPASAELYTVEISGPPDNRQTVLRDANDVTVNPADLQSANLLTIDLRFRPDGRFADELTWEGLAPDGEHEKGLSQVFAATEDASRRTALFAPLIVTPDDDLNGAAVVRELLDATDADLPEADNLTIRLALSGGLDGNAPLANGYRGEEDSTDGKSGLLAFRDLEDISIVAAPGSSAAASAAIAAGVRQELIGHCEFMRYRIAVLDSIENQLPGEVREYRGEFDTTHAALYYPWVRVADPFAVEEPRELVLPPSGFVAGIYARNDIERGVHKAPANETVRSALGFNVLVNKAQQEVLNPLGVNCLRFFEGRGLRVWGARTASSDPEWKYVNLRRYFAFLERSIEKGTQWAVFEPNGHVLWANVQRTVEDFLYNEFVSNHLAGRKPAEAFFVRCDETTMTQNDRDNGRLICLIGVAPLRPAEFVIFRIGQKTIDARG